MAPDSANDPPSEPGSSEPSPAKDPRRRVIAAGAVAAAIAIVAAIVVVSSDGGDDDGPRSAPTTASTVPAPPVLQFTVTGLDSNGTKAPDDATVAAVKRTLDGWLAAAVVLPLHSGQPAGDLSTFFTAPALERLVDPTVRATLVDEGMAPASGTITAEVATASLSSVAGPDEVVSLIGARLDLKVRGVGPTIDVDVVHQGEVILVPEGDSWKIETFAIHTTRDSRP